MRFKPRKVGERRDAANYTIEVVMTDTLGRERGSIKAWQARRWLAQMNRISPNQAQALLDQADEAYEIVQANRRVFGKSCQGDGEATSVLTDSCIDDTVIDEEPQERERKERR